MAKKTKCTKVTINPGNSVTVSNSKQDSSVTYGQYYVQKMPEYIEREAMWEEYQKCPVEFTPHGVVVDAYHVQKAIKTIPAADVVEVVRCKDCEHRYVPRRCALWYGTNNGNEYFIERGDDFSCSYGTRKEGAEK